MAETLISTWNGTAQPYAQGMDLPDAVVFDNDGLLLDTESVWTRAEQDLFARRGAEFTPADKRELVGTSAAGRRRGAGAPPR